MQANSGRYCGLGCMATGLLPRMGTPVKHLSNERLQAGCQSRRGVARVRPGPPVTVLLFRDRGDGLDSLLGQEPSVVSPGPVSVHGAHVGDSCPRVLLSEVSKCTLDSALLLALRDRFLR